MSDELQAVDLPSESETSQVVDSPEASEEPAQNDGNEEVTLTKEQKKILELKAQKKSLTEQKYKERQEKAALLAELEELRNRSQQPAQNDLDAIIEQRVQDKLLAAEEAKRNASFDKACNDVFNRGVDEYPDFDEQIQSLGAVGIDRDSIEFIAESEVGHKIINYLANDLDEADRIMKLPTLRKAKELIKLEEKVASQKKRISNSPEPIPSLGAKGSKVLVGDIVNDFDSFNKWFETGLKTNR